MDTLTPLLLTSRGHHWRPVQTCLIKELTPPLLIKLVLATKTHMVGKRYVSYWNAVLLGIIIISLMIFIFELLMKKSKCTLLDQWWIYIVKFWMCAPIGVQILSISCSFLGKFGKIICWHSLEGWRPHIGKSWIRHCIDSAVHHNRLVHGFPQDPLDKLENQKRILNDTGTFTMGKPESISILNYFICFCN